MQTGEVSSAVVSAPSAKVFSLWLGFTSERESARRDLISIVLQNAGYAVSRPLLSEEGSLVKVWQEAAQQHDAALLIIGVDAGPKLKTGASLLRLQYDTLLAQVSPQFRLIVWAPIEDQSPMDLEAQELLSHIENTLTPRVMLTRTRSLPLLIQEIHAFLQEAVEARQAVKLYDIVFIHNIQDAEPFYKLIDDVSAKYRTQTLAFRPENAVADYAEAERLYREGRLLVFLFAEAGDWAVASAIHLWKRCGGLSQPTPILLLGLPEPARNRHLSVRVPNIRLELRRSEELFAAIEAAFQTAKQTPIWPDSVRMCPYIGLRPFEERDALFFHGRERHIDKLLSQLAEKKFVMVTGASGDGKSSLVFAGVLPALRANRLPTPYPRWAIAAMRPEKRPLTNLAESLASALGFSNPATVEERLTYGFSALVDLYKSSPAYIDPTSPDFLNLPENEKSKRLRQGANLLILVDQFEEFFTNEENYVNGVASPLAQITVNLLSETIRIAQRDNLPIWVIFTMRSDYIGQCVAFHGFAELIGESTYFVPRLTREEFQAVIEKPAENNGDRITPRLTQRLLNDLGDGIDQLPVLQHALHRIWHAAQEGKETMDLLHYALVGGLAPHKLPETDRPLFEKYIATLPPDEAAFYQQGRLRNVLNTHAETLYNRLDRLYEKRYQQTLPLPLLQKITETIFVCLTRLDEGRGVRARMTLQEITDILGHNEVDYQTVARVAALFRETTHSFLQPYLEPGESPELSPNATLTISHEALIRNWDRLIRWAEAEAQSARIFKELKFQVQRWVSAGQSSKFLLSGGSYQYFAEWYYKVQPNAAWLRRYIPKEELVPDIPPIRQAFALKEAIDLYLARSKARIERNRRLLLLALAVISLLLLLSLVALYYANLQRQEALRQEAEARRQAKIALEQKALAERNAAEARRQQLIAERERLIALQQKLIAEQQTRIAQVERANAERQRQIAETQRRIAEIEREKALLQQRIAENQTRLAEASRLNAEYNQAQAEYQTRLALLERNKALILQSLFLAALSEEQTKKGHPEVGQLLALAALPRRIDDPTERPFVAEAEAALYFALDRLLQPKPLKRLVGHKNRVVYATFSPDGKTLATSSWDKTIRLWNPTTGSSKEVLRGHSHIVDRVYFSEDLRYLVSYAEDFSARIWDLSTGTAVARLSGHKDNLTHVALTKDASLILTTSLDKTARLYRGPSGELLAVLSHDTEVLYGVLTSDGRYAATATRSGALTLWDLSTPTAPKPIRIRAHGKPITALALPPNQHGVLTLSMDGTAAYYTWDGQLVVRLTGARNALQAAAFAPTSDKVVLASADSLLRLYEIPSGKLLATFSEKGHKGIPYALTFSPSGLHILSIGTDQKAILWNARTYQRLSEYPFPPHIAFWPAFSPDGKLLAVPGPKNTIDIYQVLPHEQALIDLAYEKKRRELTPEELRRFFLDDPRIQSEMPQRPKLPRARIHKVQKGETLQSIARQYGIMIEQLRELNRLSSDDIREGDSLIITYTEP
jgi:WD40 repeat protein/murein DD-endopeptidase MepM/ murein hydrolase activator NlpD